jgi:SAM-dependent methyltransferase
MQARLDYDQIAPRYDAQPFRAKEIDPNLLTFLEKRAADEQNQWAILDIGCGTGNQLVANRAKAPTARLVGLDLSRGMLRRARSKAGDIGWVQANGATLPFPGESFDFITSQYSFHHVADKPALVLDVFRVLRPGGRFVMTNLCPREMRGWAIYRYFPSAVARDRRDFMPREEIKERMSQAGFAKVETELERQEQEQALRDFAELVRQRDSLSQLLVISDADYHAGLQRIEAELSRAGGHVTQVSSELCRIKVVGDKTVWANRIS